MYDLTTAVEHGLGMQSSSGGESNCIHYNLSSLWYFVCRQNLEASFSLDSFEWMVDLAVTVCVCIYCTI